MVRCETLDVPAENRENTLTYKHTQIFSRGGIENFYYLKV